MKSNIIYTLNSTFSLVFLFIRHLFVICVFIMCINNITLAQNNNKRLPKENINGVLIGYKIENGDTLYVDKLKPAYAFNRPKNWKKSKQWRDYYRTVYNFKKVYPYALIAKRIVKEADSTLANTNLSRRGKEKYIKKYEKRLFYEFEKPLRNLSFSQGRLLLRLIDREVGKTSFYIIKGYKGGFTATFWQGIARLFGSDLKRPYDKFGEDKVVEELVKLYEEGSFDYLYYSMFSK